MAQHEGIPLAIDLSTDVEYRPDRPTPYRARVRWVDPATGRRTSKSEAHATEPEAQEWLDALLRAARRGIAPDAATAELAAYGQANMELALRGLEKKTHAPYLAGWRRRVVPAMGHLPLQMVTYGAVDRVVHGWIADGISRSSVKNSLAVLVRVMEQALRDGIIDRNPARITGWQSQYQRHEDELDNPRALALPDFPTLTRLADALVERSADNYRGWGDVVTFMACTAARIGEASGVRAGDIDTHHWIWTVRRQTTTAPGGLIDKGTKGKRARRIPLIEEVRPLIAERLLTSGGDPDARLFRGPRGGRITTAVLRDAAHWDEVVTRLGYEHLRRHDLRHTGLTWMADAGIPLHVLRLIAGHGSLTTTQRYLHPDLRSLHKAGTSLTNHLNNQRPTPVPRPVPLRNTTRAR
ncbi:site-specific integrase [Streptomyces sp. MP131-18]|uniref:tyrosine-type recombinase/integrase n=1 Tax=Streptomyces sp. MP131-18 TaxID=1857892 RepID=UPI00097BB01E|nr:site-specific integrase [Streptomyces sp. MP131-18]ONK09550.1 Tyrosine recombinase XerC [Streptomyces sp. MP131-18]